MLANYDDENVENVGMEAARLQEIIGILSEQVKQQRFLQATSQFTTNNMIAKLKGEPGKNIYCVDRKAIVKRW